MSAIEITRYALDPTGVNPDNAVQGEIKDLSAAQIRAAAPVYGPFFSESLAIWDHISGRQLTRGPDYQVVELLQDATLKYGKEIAQLVLILNPEVNSKIRLNYQSLGGLYQNDTSNLVSIYDAYMKDDRPISWVNVLNQPEEYPPTLHRHFLEDVYGFEAIIASLERIRNAIVLSDVPAFEALIDWVKSRGMTIQDVQAGRNYDKFVTGEVLAYALSQFTGTPAPSPAPSPSPTPSPYPSPAPAPQLVDNTMLELYNACCLYNAGIRITPRSYWKLGTSLGGRFQG